MEVSVVSLKEKLTQHWVFLLSNCPQVLKNLFMINPLNITLTMLVYDYSNI